MRSRNPFYIVLMLSLGMTTLLPAQSGVAYGRLEFNIVDSTSGQRIPGKLVFLQNGKPVKLEVKSAGLMASRENTVYTGSGEGTISIPVGDYEVWAGRGMEYSADVQQVAIQPEAETHATFHLRRVVDTRGFICGDLHLHTLTYSGHGDSNVEERIISCLGEGLEWAVATDHNHVTDYAPVSRSLGLEGAMLTTPGNEVSTPIGHFNAFPLPSGSAPVPHDLKDAGTLFKLIRAEDADVVIQVNHPRWPGAAYFSELGLDPLLAKTSNDRWSWDFDAFEVLNENRGLGWIAEPDNPISVREDWFNLLNSGRRFTAVGNSDSHHVLDLIAGIPRNYIASSTDDPAALDEAELVENLKRRNVTVARGLFVELTANDGVPIGQMTGLKNGRVDLHIRVQAPPWIGCDTVSVIANGEVVRIFSLRPQGSVVKFARSIRLRPQTDTWYVVEARGSEPMRPLYHDAPVPITPLGFTNPIWVDADGDGKFTSLREHAARLVTRFANAPARLAAAVRNQPHLLRFVVGKIAGLEVAAQAKLLRRLWPLADLESRILMIKCFDEMPAPLAAAHLEFAARTATRSLEKLLLALARVHHGEIEQWPEAVHLMHQVPESRYQKAALQKLSRGAYMRAWHVVGPFDFEDDDGLDRRYPPERQIALDEPYRLSPQHQIYWRDFVAPSHGRVNFNAIFGEHENAVAYAYTQLEARQDGAIVLLLGSDDGVAVWLNGAEVHRQHTHRGLRPGDDAVPLSLQAGSNTLLIKVENRSGDWEFAAEILDPDEILARFK